MDTGVVAEMSLQQQFRSEGFFVARQLLLPAEVKEIGDAFTAAAANGPVPGLSAPVADAGATDPLARWPRIMHPHRHMESPLGPLTRRYLFDQRVKALLWQFLGTEAWAVNSMFYFKPPGARGQELHQDNFYLRVRPGTCLAAWIAIDDCDAENGALQVVPGSQNMQTVCPEKADQTRSFTAAFVRPPAPLKPMVVDMQAGDALFFNGQIIHGSGPNTSPHRFRRALIFHYIPAGSTELGEYYSALDFSGTAVGGIRLAVGGGPCGDEFAIQGPH